MPSKEAVQRARDNYNSKVDILTIRIDPKINQLFKNYCADTKQTKKQVIEAALSEYIDKH